MTTRPTVLILAAGENSRFFPLNTNRHKAAQDILGEPLIVRTLRSLQQHHFYDVIVLVSEKDYGGNGLSSELQKYDLYLKLSFVLQPQALGMGDAVLSAIEHIGESFAVVSPYTINAGSLVEELMKHSGDDGAIAVTETTEPWLYGVISYDEKRITGIVEKPERGSEPSNLETKCWLLSRKYLEILKQQPSEQYSFEAALNVFFRKHEVNYFKQAKSFPSLKYPWHFFDFQTVLFQEIRSFTAPDVEVAPTAVIDDSQGPVVIESGARIGHAAKLLGPCYIGRHAMVGDFSFIRGSSIEEDVTIGSNTEVVRSIFLPRSEMHFGYIADSIVGYNAKIGAGLITANKRHDREHVKVLVKDQRVDVGRNNLGVLVGDYAKIGVRCTTMPGIAIGANSVIYPTMTLYGNVDHDATIK